ncbi:DUF6338 family protein [Actinoplanes sp. URMC 104]|uniref:DUF6338 family protein n=1 Tax=Actinoplanes sp. URMC 104 TaxID=3423409 RepID=UPI003F1A9EAA
MIPETLGALLALLFLIAPGLVYTSVLELRRPPTRDSAFIEASRVALSSLAFGMASALVLGLLHVLGRIDLPDPGRWLSEGARYTAENFQQVVVAVFLQTALSCALAGATGWMATRRLRSRYRDDTVFGSVFRRYPPVDHYPWVHVRLDNDIEYWGFERMHDDRDEAGTRMIVLQGKGLQRKLPGENGRLRIGDTWDVVAIDADRIRCLEVVYISRDGKRRGATSTDEPEGRPLSAPEPT